MSNLTTHSYGNDTLRENPNLCTLDTCDLTLASFTYLPTLPGNALFAGLFGVFVVGQLYLGIRHKIWGYMTAMVLGLLLEIGGYVARVLLHGKPFENNYFLIYLICLTIAPAFLTAGIYLCLGRIVHVYGENLSYFKPRTYTIVFCTCDFISLVLQGAGGGIASTADDLDGKNLGKNMMLAGLIFQVFSLGLFAGACGDFALRVMKSKRGWNVRYIDLVNSRLFKAFLIGLFVASITIVARSVYRCVELAGGFDSELFTGDEPLFMILEGAMIVIATGCLTLLHPAIAFQGAWHEANFAFRTKGGVHKQLSSDDEESQMNIELAHQTPFIKK